MKPTIKTLITAALLSSMVFSLQFCKKKDLTVEKDPRIANLIAELSSKPQLVFQSTVLTPDQVKQLIAASRSQSARTMACPGTLYSAVVGYNLTWQGTTCNNGNYKVSVTYALWSNEQTDNGPRDHGNPDPTVSGVTLTINSTTLYPDLVAYNVVDDMAWWATFEFRYSDVGLSLSSTSIATTIFGTFTCANSATANVNNNHTLPLTACNSVGVMYPNQVTSGQIDFFFPWTLFCYPGLTPDEGFEIKYRVSGSGGSWTTVSSSTPVTGPFIIYNLTPNTLYEYMSRYLCSTGSTYLWYFGTFTPS